uniref:Arp2/3 complex 41 kDa subunit n=1 Tax=Emiliania huxleyi (strain CCMP1516) TaxID=280463 RepID=A0A0D3I2P7_EMIH1
MEARVESAITIHAWNADRTLLAVCPNDNTIAILKVPTAEPLDGPWERVATLSEHDALVTGIAWAPTSNKIVTVSQDRNAYVWTQVGGEWKPSLVILRIAAAATSVQWSPGEEKFAVGSGPKVGPVCSYEGANDFGVWKRIKDPSSTVGGVGGPPRARFLPTGWLDCRCRGFPAPLRNIDGKKATTPWGAAAKFGTLLYTYEAHGWVLDVAFSAAGDALALTAQNSTVAVVDMAAAAAGSEGAAQTIRLSELPLTKLLFLPDGQASAALRRLLPPPLPPTAASSCLCRRLPPPPPAAAASSCRQVVSARRMFQAAASTGTLDSGAATLASLHQFAVCGLQRFGGRVVQSDAVFTSSALDGKIVGWSAREIAAAAQ